jgi:hypothetical protein
MKKSIFLVSSAVLLIFALCGGLAGIENKVLTVPKGTTIEKIEPGHFKLKGPEGCVFEVRGFQRSGKGQATFGEVGILGDCGIFDKNGKIIATGAKGILKSGPKPAGYSGKGAVPANIPATDYIKIDDEVTWLPAMIEFQPSRIFNRPALQKLSPQPDPPGKK